MTFGEWRGDEDGSSAREVHIEETAECVRALCQDANASTGCDLSLMNDGADGRFVVQDRNGCAWLCGTAAELLDLLHVFQGGYFTALVDSGLAAKPDTTSV